MQQNHEHEQRVARIAGQVADRAARGAKVHITKKSVHHVVPLPGDRRFANEPIDISALCNLLSIDAEALTCTCEPGVSFRELVRTTLPLGLIPTVVPELEGITVGGAVAGCSVEAMSSPVPRPVMSTEPSHSAPRISARWLMLLSPGTRVVPRRLTRPPLQAPRRWLRRAWRLRPVGRC